MIKIEPLTKEILKEASGLVDLVFPLQEQGEESARVVLSASLNPEKYKEHLVKSQIVPDLRYWLVIDKLGGVRGIIGLYRYERDKEEAFWLGWFCVHPDARKRGIGTELLQFSINQAKENGKRFLRLYTSNDPNEHDAQRLYEKYGFELIGDKPFSHSGLRKLYYELKLRGAQ